MMNSLKSSAAMTVFGALGASLAVVLFELPDDTPLWLKIALHALNAAVTFMLGQTHPGFNKPRRS